MSSVLATYREFAPCKALQADVYALFSFVPGPGLTVPSRPLLREVAFNTARPCAPQFADGHVSMMFELGQTFDAAGRWRVDSTAQSAMVIGPMRSVGRTADRDLSATVGVFFRPARAGRFFDVAGSELTDSPVSVGDIWGTSGSRLASDLSDLSDAARLDRLESILLTRLQCGRHRTGSLDIEGLAAGVLRRQGRVRVDALARAAGVSRQRLFQAFRERIGIGPKLYIRLARFQSVLAYSGARAPVDWASVAADLGFFDQSHLIAECRQFSGLTPQALADRDWFHPFIERASSRPFGALIRSRG